MSLLRTRRRRVTFGLFGSSSRVPVTLAPAGAGFWSEENVVLDGDRHDAGAASVAQEPDAPLQEEAMLAELVTRLNRQALADPRLRARASEEELARRVSQAVTALWAESKVKGFVAVLAMRRVRDELGLPER